MQLLLHLWVISSGDGCKQLGRGSGRVFSVAVVQFLLIRASVLSSAGKLSERGGLLPARTSSLEPLG